MKGHGVKLTGESDMELNIENSNRILRHKSPQEIIRWVLEQSKRPILTTNFGPRSASLLHAISQIDSNVEVVWIDTGYNTSYTYKFANDLIERLNLNMNIYVPRQTVAFRNAAMGMPEVGSSEHQEFTKQVKLEPFSRALKVHNPDVWFSNIRKGQTAFRDTLDILSIGANGILKVAPFYYYSDEEVDDYLARHGLPDQKKYFDPTKVSSNRECGLHTLV